jgi:hypothetical protein
MKTCLRPSQIEERFLQSPDVSQLSDHMNSLEMVFKLKGYERNEVVSMKQEQKKANKL